MLVAEDDAGLREVLVQGLEDAGYQVDAVGHGDDAIEQLKFYDYDVARGGHPRVPPIVLAGRS